MMKMFPRSFLASVVAWIALLSCLAAFCAAQTSPPLPAFPGASGFGAGASGGLGGTTYHVVSLNDSGSGTFRDAVSQGHRTVVFDVGGTILLNSPVAVHSDLTLSGQTAPGAGITVTGQEVSFSNSRNVIVRFLRFRQGLTGNHHKSAVNIRGGSNLIFDHVSVAWGRWDTIDMNGGSDITFQYCLIGPGINPQRFGCLCQCDRVTFSHCLWIDNQSRNPKAKGSIQYINNVVYDWGVGGLVGGHSAANHSLDVIGNYFIKGPSSHDRFTGEYRATDHVYQIGNRADLDRDGKLNGRPVVAADFGSGPDAPTLIFAPSLTPTFPVPLDTPEQAYAKVLADVGDAHPRDAVDTRLISELTSLGLRGQTIEDPAEMDGPPPLKSTPVPRADAVKDK